MLSQGHESEFDERTPQHQHDCSNDSLCPQIWAALKQKALWPSVHTPGEGYTSKLVPYERLRWSFSLELLLSLPRYGMPSRMGPGAGMPSRGSQWRAIVKGLPISASWQDLKVGHTHVATV